MSKFQLFDHYSDPLTDGYRLLPFNFTPLGESDYVLSNQAGDYVVLDRPALRDFVEHRLSPLVDEYWTLKAKHFLIDSDSNVALDLLALKVRTKQNQFANFTGLHIFVVTLRCEHSCPYCQVSRKNDGQTAFDMSIELADRALDMVFRSPSPVIKIEFQGGEPLLHFSLIKHIVEAAERRNETRGRDLSFVIATNLALITDDILRYCATHEIFISTSLDGPADIHNRNRPRPGGDSYEKAVAGIQRVRERLGRDRVSALMTTTERSLDRVRDIVDEYAARGFNRIFLRPLSPYGFAVKTKAYASYEADAWLDFYFEGLDYILGLNRSGIFFVEEYAALILTKMLTPFNTGYVDLRSPAGIGIGAVVYNYDGDIYASDEARMLAEMGDKTFRLGSLLTDSWETVMTSDALLDPLEASFAGSAPMCSDCAFEPYCGADPVFHHATQGDVIGHKPTSAFCKRSMAICRRLISLMRDDTEAHRILQTWVKV